MKFNRKCITCNNFINKSKPTQTKYCNDCKLVNIIINIKNGNEQKRYRRLKLKHNRKCKKCGILIRPVSSKTVCNSCTKKRKNNDNDKRYNYDKNSTAFEKQIKGTMLGVYLI